jgi:hypothetical protein
MAMLTAGLMCVPDMAEDGYDRDGHAEREADGQPALDAMPTLKSLPGVEPSVSGTRSRPPRAEEHQHKSADQSSHNTVWA